MTKVKEKVERRLGEKLFLKGERCAGPKCAFTRRSYPPGTRSRKARRRGLSEYGTALKEKQKIRFSYGLDDKTLERYVKEAASRPGIFNSSFLAILERRLDNVLFRLGLAISRRIARQAVSHGHVLVNEKRVTVPSYRVKVGDTVSFREQSLKSPFYIDLEARLKKYEAPKWLSLDKSKKTGRIIALPDTEDAGTTVEIMKIKEFYSR